MALQTRYSGEFISRKGVTYRVDILQESTFPYDEVGELMFDADNALEIEWDESDKMAAVLGSTATLKIISPSDRKYIDLYTIAVGQIRMDVYCEGVLYWRGMLDPEFYEEPYEMLDGYTVTLSFSDFGILDRLVFNRATTGITDLKSLLEECLERAGLEYTYDDVVEYISTSISTDATPMTLGDLSVRNSNFYDEEGEAMTMQEALEGILQPLALRVTQKAGKIWLYDLNELYYSGEQKDITWSSTTQTLGVDVVYNNVKITFSPYAQNIDFDSECWDDEIDETLWHWGEYGFYLNDDSSKAHYFGYTNSAYNSEEEESVTLAEGFTFWTSKKGKTVDVADIATTGGMNPDGYLHPLSPRYFKVVPFYIGDEDEGIMIRFTGWWEKDREGENEQFWYYGMEEAQINGGVNADTYYSGTYRPHNVIFDMGNLEIPNLPNPSDYAVCISIEMQINGNYSPYHDVDVDFDYTWYPDSNDHKKECNTTNEMLKASLQYILVPVEIAFETDDGEYYYWENIESLDDKGFPDLMPISYLSYKQSLGKWVKSGEGHDLGKAFFAYFSTSDPTDGCSSCIAGWGSNSHFGGLSDVVLAQATKITGQNILYPNVGKSGKLHIAVYSDWLFYKWNPLTSQNRFALYGASDTSSGQTSQAVWECMKWILAKVPTLKIVNSDASNLDLNTDDIEYSAVINADAKEDLEVDTVCGTGVDRPTARGAYYKTDNAEMMDATFTRADLTGAVEELFIATAYSQYAERHTTLQGEANIETDTLYVFKEQNQDDKLFLATSLVENLIQDVADTTLSELSYDDYEPVTD